MWCQPSFPRAILPRTNLLSYHSSITKRYHETIARHILISEYQADIAKAEEIWYQRNRQLKIDIGAEEEELYQEVEAENDKLHQEKDKLYQEVEAEKDKLHQEKDKLYQEAKAEKDKFYHEKDKFYQELNEEKDKLHQKLLNYTVENTRLQFGILKEIDEKLRISGNFNVCGALRRIVSQAKWAKVIPDIKGVQTGLNALAATPEFKEILQKVVDDRGLVYEQVKDQARLLYDEVSKRAHGNDNIITVRAKDFTPRECAALVTYLLLQSEWPIHLEWREEK